MRTTLDIADDVLAAARERARRNGTSIGAALSELAREALTTSPATQATPTTRGFRPFPKRGGVVTNELIDGLREDED